MQVEFDDLSAAASRLLRENGSPDIARDGGGPCAWLQACFYPGLELLSEAADTTPVHARHPVLPADPLGLDLANIPCVSLASRLTRLVEQQGRMFLRNVRHGLY